MGSRFAAASEADGNEGDRKGNQTRLWGAFYVERSLYRRSGRRLERLASCKADSHYYVLVRDMTDTMYNHRMRPHTDHFSETDLVVRHVEEYWCPTIESMGLVGGKLFRFAEDPKTSVAARR